MSKQGDFDGLCGIYAIINAIGHLVVLNENDRTRLFKKIVTFLEKDNANVKNMLLNGMELKSIRSVLIKLAPYLKKTWGVEIEIDHFMRRSAPNVAAYWKRMSEYIPHDTKRRNTGEYNRVVIIGLSEKHNHWTCVQKVTRSKLFLIDSMQLKHINRHRCTLGRTTRQKHYWLDRREVIGLRVAS